MSRKPQTIGRRIATAASALAVFAVGLLVVGTWLMKSRADGLVRERARDAERDLVEHVERAAEVTRLLNENLAQSPVFRTAVAAGLDRDTLDDAFARLTTDQSLVMVRVTESDGHVIAARSPDPRAWDGIATRPGFDVRLLGGIVHVISTIDVELRPGYAVAVSVGRRFALPEGSSNTRTWYVTATASAPPDAPQTSTACGDVAGLERLASAQPIACAVVAGGDSHWVVELDVRSEWLNLISLAVASGSIILVALLSALWLLRLVVRRDRELMRAKDSAEAAGRAKGEFLAMMSHEIRTPMNAVLGMSELLQRTAVDERQARYLATLRTSATALLSLINDILDLSKVDSNNLVLRLSDVDIRETLEEVCAAHAQAAQAKGVELVCDVPTSVPTRIQVDGDRLRQVVMNLVSNAVKFTDKGEITVRARGTVVADRVELSIEVIDTGVGMSREEQEKLFTPFWQADASYRRKVGGTGLGLAIANRIAKVMGSELRVSSEPGKGSRFSFSFAADRAKSARARRATGRVLQLRVLVVDDNETNRLIVSEQLRAWGMECTTTDSGENALARWDAARATDKPFEVILLDGHMIGMTGIEVARKLRELEPGPLKVVMMTSMDSNPDEAREARVDDWLTKPVRQSQLYDCLSRLNTSGSRPASAAPVEVPSKTKHANARVLVVEDNEVNRMVVVDLLAEIGVVPRMAVNGIEAVALVEKQRFDVVFMDCQMPLMDGYEATGRIRQLEGNARRTPILALTAHAMAGDREIALAAGMDDYLTKPVTVAALAGALDRWHRTEPLPPKLEPLPEPLPAPDPLPDVLDPKVGRKPMIIELFLKLGPAELEGIKAATDATSLRQLSHKLKGSAFALGLKRLASTCSEVEKLSRAGDFEAAQSLVPRLATEFDVTTSALRDELEHPQAAKTA